jgi:ribosomal-protein-alanine N-acetyltransferase
MSNFPAIATERTLLHLLAPQNAHLARDYHEVNRQHLEPWEPQRAADFHSEASFSSMAERSHGAFLAGTEVKLIAVDRASGKMVASCSFTNIVRGPLQACHMGYSVARPLQGRGLMHEVASASIRYMFDVQGLHRIMANHMPSNVRSESLLARLGFEREGYARAYLKIAGQWQDMVLNSLISPI